MHPQDIFIQNVFGKVEQEAKKFIVSLEGDSETVTEVLRYIWNWLFCMMDIFIHHINILLMELKKTWKNCIFFPFITRGQHGETAQAP